jgi:hypothetical protein
MRMISATNEDKQKWIRTILTTHDPAVVVREVEKIWEDGYRCAEAEVTYAVTPEGSR